MIGFYLVYLLDSVVSVGTPEGPVDLSLKDTAGMNCDKLCSDDC